MVNPQLPLSRLDTDEAIMLRSPRNVASYLHEYYQDVPELKEVDRVLPVRPWMLINWPFIDRTDDIMQILDDRGVHPEKALDIQGYTQAGKYLYPKSSIEPHDFDTWGWYAVSRILPPEIGESGKLLILDEELLNPEEYKKIFEAKNAVRRALGSKCFMVIYKEERFATDFRSCHAPDYENVQTELDVMSRFLKPTTDAGSSDSVETVTLNPPITTFAAMHLDPFEYLIDPAESTPYECLYKNRTPEIVEGAPLVIILAGPSGAGKDTVASKLVGLGSVAEAKPATTRARRIGNKSTEDEPVDKYVWMRPQKEGETDETYRQALMDEYGLIECEFHNGNYYGLPLESLEESTANNRTTIVISDGSGAEKIKDILRNKATCLTIFVTPDSYEDIWRHVVAQDNSSQRMVEATTLVAEGPIVADYYLHNSRHAGGLQRAVNSLTEFISDYHERNEDAQS